ncbi:MAG TPA: hypothetical protein VL200_07425 [Lacunisphaera sp.]|jgi:hypothetical protein|nr:hypothetical protein [Lacunisphaera sp.]
MTHLPIFPLTSRLAALVASIGLLSSCATARQPEAMSIYSPPPPRLGSAPISAYDAYAAATNLPAHRSSDLLAALVAEVAANPFPRPIQRESIASVSPASK